jgi:1-acyl-sn-glycerol-3-phosphate acyltransferase
MRNHQSHFDVLALAGHWRRQTRWVLKEELRKIPVFGWYCEAGGHIIVDRSSPEHSIESIRNAQVRLEGGISVMIFPEGTRSRDIGIGDFKKGGFMMALELGMPILPISISGSRHVLPSKTLKLLPGNICIQVHEPVDVGLYGLKNRED